MMTEENIKEALSIRYIEILANYKGYKTSSIFPDHGTDLSIVEVSPREENQGLRYFDTGRELKVQLKATTERGVILNENELVYDLEAKTYNDLIYRMNNNKPLLLFLFILPSDNEDWLKLSDKELIIKKCAYWFYPEKADITTGNTHSKRINISYDNLVSIDTIDKLFEIYG